MAVTDYLRGAGTSADPYIIHNVAAWTQFFNVDKNSGKYFEVIADIDCSGAILSGVAGFAGELNGNGHKVYGFSSPSTDWFSGLSSTYKKLKKIYISAGYTGKSYPLSSGASTKYMDMEDVRLDFTTLSSGWMFYALNSDPLIKMENVVITYYGTRQLARFASSNDLTHCYIIAPNTSGFNISGPIRLSPEEAINPSSYPTLGDAWIIDAVSIPYLYPNGRQDLTTKYAIKGSTKIGGISKKRKIALLTSAYLGLLKKIDTADDGTYLIDMGDIYDPVYVMHYDDYGFPLFASTAYAIGAYIHPKTPNGYRYKCTTAGTSGASLPAEPWPTSSNLTSGTAIFSPEPVYKTETFLVSPHLYDFLTGQPV